MASYAQLSTLSNSKEASWNCILPVATISRFTTYKVSNPGPPFFVANGCLHFSTRPVVVVGGVFFTTDNKCMWHMVQKLR